MHYVTSFYLFKPQTPEQLKVIEDSLNVFGDRMLGLVLLGTEGINATVSGPQDLVPEFKKAVEAAFDAKIDFKDSVSTNKPFRDFRIRYRKEIVTLGRPDIVPNGEANHLTPQEWHNVLSNEEVVLIDTRNTYETEIGKFKNAIDMRMEEFSQFPEKIKELGLKKDQKVLMYCTGGIRCEKAMLSMTEQGYTNVFQLKGGILEYLKEFPDQHYDGECFVFDYRVAVDQKLNPSARYRFCPHCGQPASQKIECVRCDTAAVVCQSCLDKHEAYKTCSKNCAHHERIKSKSKKPNMDELLKRLPV